MGKILLTSQIISRPKITDEGKDKKFEITKVQNIDQ